MRIIPFFIIFIISVISLSLQASVINKQLSIRILSHKDSLPVCNALVVDASHAIILITDSNGVCTLPSVAVSSSMVLYVTHLSYRYDSIIIVPTADLVLKYLKPKSIPLPEIEVSYISAAHIVRLALEKLPQTHQHTNMKQNFFYRQYHYENNKPVRWIECNVVAKYDETITTKGKNVTKLYVYNLSRSMPSEQNKDIHGDHMADLFDDIPTINMQGTICNIKGISFFDFDYDTANETSEFYAMRYKATEPVNGIMEWGQITIDKKDTAIVKIITEKVPTPSYFNNLVYATKIPYVWELSSSHAEFYYIKSLTGYSLQNCFKTYTHNLYSTATHTYDYVVTENFELHASTPLRQLLSDKDFSVFSNLYSRQALPFTSKDSKYPCVFCK